MQINPAHAFHYGYFVGQGRDLLKAELHADDPFGLSPAEIVDRLIAAGFVPILESELRHPLRTSGRIANVDRGEQRFIVAVDPAAETISVQDVRADAY